MDDYCYVLGNDINAYLECRQRVLDEAHSTAESETRAREEIPHLAPYAVGGIITTLILAAVLAIVIQSFWRIRRDRFTLRRFFPMILGCVVFVGAIMTAAVAIMYNSDWHDFHTLVGK